ncbi:membrane protein [Suillus subalutaceus]|uniref:uncharacterized protein n=1 Tax=Suillus subalutaceus TaxID=48586 RepID=UPI001B862FCD|nr:uncharacterized protein DFJ58DRAFT_863209 [Suillus subalutaceus]KAG1837160.1 membrane protein [Suillus subalutaceus]
MSPSSTEKPGAHCQSPEATADKIAAAVEESWPTKDFGLIPIPKRLQYNPIKPFHFGISLNVSFGFASTLTVANLYYCQPLLSMLLRTNHIASYANSTPMIIFAGSTVYVYIAVLSLSASEAQPDLQRTFDIINQCGRKVRGLAITNNLLVFEIISFLIGLTSVTPQILVPLAADLPPPARRGSAISVVLSGYLLGILIARVLSGMVANFTGWRIVYCMSIGVQSIVLGGAYMLLPDYPVKNCDLSYLGIFRSMAKYIVTEPLVSKIMFTNWAASACFTNWWVTLTFLLGGPSYGYSTMIIGLFGLIGMLGVIIAPFFGRLLDRLAPWWSAVVSTVLLLVFQAVQTGAGGINIAAVVISYFVLDLFRQTQSISLSALMFRYSIMCFQLAVLSLRGPHCPGNR